MVEKFGKRNEKRIRFFVALSVFAVVLTAIILIVISLFSGDKSVNNSIIVYKNDIGNVIKIGKLEYVVSDLSADNFRCDSDNKRVFYTVPSSYSDGLYDLYYIEKDRSELTKPKIIDYGIEDGYILNSGKIFYLKNNSQAGALDALCCDIDKSEIKTFSSNVENIYPLDNSNSVFFIKLHGSERVLYKFAGETPVEVSRNISDIYLFNECENPHIFYEKESQIYNGMTELYRTQAEGSPELICDNTYEVLYDSYSPDGNLYYFTTSTENISWSYVIADAYSETDKTLTRPERKSFLSILGISVEYNEKLREYQDKLVRDEIREALNESVEKGEFSAPVYTAFAYNSDGSHKITENINPDAVYTVAPFGLPRIIYESFEITKSVTDMTVLVDIAQRSSMAEVIEYARSVVNNSINSTGIKVAGCDYTAMFSESLDGYDTKKTTFVFSEDGKRIFALVRDSGSERLSLFTCSLGSDLKPSAKINVSNGISNYYFIDNSIVYLKSDIGKNTGDIYQFSGDKSIKLSNAANALMVECGDKIITLKAYDGKEYDSVADFYYIDDAAEKLISTKILIDSFVMDNSGKSAFISNEKGKRTLMVFDDDSTTEISDGVNELILFD